MSLVITGVLAKASLQRESDYLDALAGDETLDLGKLVAGLFTYLGTPHPAPLARLSSRMAYLAFQVGILQPGELPFKPDGTLCEALLAVLSPRLGRYLPLIDHDAAIRMPLLDEAANIYLSTELPPRLNRRLDHHRCPAFIAFQALRQCLYVGPQGFSVFDAASGQALRAATSRPFGQGLLAVAPALTTLIPVLVQDIFNGFNFAHFLFDWMARATVFASSDYFDPARHVFVFGGLPNSFHDIVIEGFKSAFGLSDLNIFFPTEPVVLDCPNGVVFFSDTRHVTAHPAQMCRDETVELLRRVVGAVPVKRAAGTRRIYISREDAGRRMLRNERALLEALVPLGFEAVRLADHSVERQIALMASAECIVGAHGMGLTHMSFHPGRPRVIELFNPLLGTDTYAFPAKALRFDYQPVIGTAVTDSDDFAIDVAEVLAALEGFDSRGSEARQDKAKSFELDMANWSSGVQRIKAVEIQPEIAPHPRLPAFHHARNVEIEDTNVGWWRVSGLRPGHIYRMSCHVIVPTRFTGERVVLAASNWASVDADLDLRDQWQRLKITRTCPDDTDEVNLVLRVFAATDTSVLSSGWEVHEGLL